MTASTHRLQSRLLGTVSRGVESGVLVSAVFLIGLFAVLIARQPSILEPTQLRYLIINASLALALAAAGLALVVLVGGLDLSVAGVIAVSNAILTTQLRGGVLTQILVLLAVIALGAVIGFLNGFIVTRFRLEPVVVTLGTGFVLGGVALLLLPKPAGIDPSATGVVSVVTGEIFGIPIGALVLALIFWGWWAIRRSRFGSALIAVGSDPEAAAQNGIAVNRTKLAAFTGSGALYALAGIALTSQTLGGDPLTGGSFLLGTFAAVVIGGLRLGGGRGSISGALLGAITITIAVNVLFVLGFASYWSTIARGLLLLLAIALQSVAVLLLRRARPTPPPIRVGEVPAASERSPR